MDNKIVGVYRYEDYDKDGNKVDTYCYVEEDMSTGELKYNFTTDRAEAVDAIYRYGKENNYKSIDEMVKSRPLAFNLNCKDASDVFSKIKMYNFLSNEDRFDFIYDQNKFKNGNTDDDEDLDDDYDDSLNPDDDEDLDDDYDDSLNPDDDEDLDDDYDDSLNPGDDEDLDDDYDETFADKHPKIAAILNKIPFVKKGKWLEPKDGIKKKLPKGVKKLKVAIPYVTAVAVAITGGFGLYKLSNTLYNLNNTKTAGTLADNTGNNLDDNNNKANKAKEEAEKQKKEEEKKKQEEEAKKKAEEEKAKQEAEAKAKVATTSTSTRASSNETYTHSGNSSSGSGSSWSGGSSSNGGGSSSSGNSATDTSMPEFQDPNQTIENTTSNQEQTEQSQEEEKYDNVFENEGTVSVIEGEENTNNNQEPSQEIEVPAKTDDNETPNDNTTDQKEDEENIEIGDVDTNIPEGAIDSDLSYEYEEGTVDGSNNYDEVIDVEPEPLPSPDEVYEFAGDDNVATEDEIKDAEANQATEDTSVETVPVEQAEATPVEASVEPEPTPEPEPVVVSEPAPVETVPVEQQTEPITTEQAVDQAVEAMANGTDGNLVVGADGNITFEENTDTNTIEANGMTK